MDTHTLFLFSVTVLPLICTPGPDMLFIASQAVGRGTFAGLRATAGVVLGYCVHSMMVALGLAAVVAASPILFETLRWIGISYLLYLAYKLIRSALTPGAIAVSGGHVKDQLTKGFLTALLNPKGMMIYIAILPQFMGSEGNAALSAMLLSTAFMFWCAVVYSILSVVVGRAGGMRTLSDIRRRMIDGVAGGMILLAAGFMGTAHR